RSSPALRPPAGMRAPFRGASDSPTCAGGFPRSRGCALEASTLRMNPVKRWVVTTLGTSPTSLIGSLGSPSNRSAPCWSTRREGPRLQPECAFSSTKARGFDDFGPKATACLSRHPDPGGQELLRLRHALLRDRGSRQI